MKTNLTILLVILLTIIFLERECSGPPAVELVPDTIRIATVEYDSVLVVKQIKQFYPVDKIIIKEVPANIDTSAILNIYFAKNIYSRLLMDDTTAMIRIIDTVHQNQLWGSQLEYKNRQPVTIHETYIIHPADAPRFQLYAGGFVQVFNPKSEIVNPKYFGIGPAIFVKTKRDHLYGVGYDPINKSAQLHMQWKISLKPR